MEMVTACLAEATIVVLSDYAKGTLTRNLCARIIAAAGELHVHVIVDPKGADFSRYRGASLVTPNLAELGAAVNRHVSPDDGSVEAAARELLEVIGCAALLVTRGERGVMAVPVAGDAILYPAEANQVVDVSGAGDTLVAGIALAFDGHSTLANSAQIGNAAAGLAVAKLGTATVTAEELRDVLLSRPSLDIEAKVASSREALAHKVAEWRKEGLSVGVANGCFDILHPGHIELLRTARRNCDRLVVALNSDASVKRLKGPSRPLQNEAARTTVMSALGFVDAVAIFDEDTPYAFLSEVRPNVLFKGADYALAQVVGRDIVEADGGRVILIDIVPDISSTLILKTNPPKS